MTVKSRFGFFYGSLIVLLATTDVISESIISASFGMGSLVKSLLTDGINAYYFFACKGAIIKNLGRGLQVQPCSA